MGYKDHGMCVEVQEQLYEVSSLTVTREFQGMSSGQAFMTSLYQPSQRTSLYFTFFLKLLV